ncbi:MAG TPA: hypothetical protein VFW02_03225 [Candidatus Limnocylindrales bacterium]|nr:hypothetical protein [Candidatus Limnocylindrales bacterium]
MTTRDWLAWHADYDADTPLRYRVLAVQRRIRETLDARPAGAVRVVSLCAGEGRDLLEVLAGHPRARDVRGRLVELDPELASRAAAMAPAGVAVQIADAGSTDAFVGAVPADLVLVCGVFGNLSDVDIEHTVRSLPMLCAPGATVIWTRHRRPPDRTVDIRRWFTEAGFQPVAFDAPTDFEWSVGVQRFAGDPVPLVAGRRLFSFLASG